MWSRNLLIADIHYDDIFIYTRTEYILVCFLRLNRLGEGGESAAGAVRQAKACVEDWALGHPLFWESVSF